MNQTVIFIIFGGLMAWSIYRRARRNIGRQKLRPKRIIFRLALIVVASLLISLIGLVSPRMLEGFGGGLLAGALLGLAGLKLTRFETTDEGHFYTPDTRIGVGLTMLLAGRVIYRMFALRDMAYAQTHPQATQSPLTFFIVGVTFGYYLVYLIGLLIHTHDKNNRQNALPPRDSV